MESAEVDLIGITVEAEVRVTMTPMLDARTMQQIGEVVHRPHLETLIEIEEDLEAGLIVMSRPETVEVIEALVVEVAFEIVTTAMTVVEEEVMDLAEMIETEEVQKRPKNGLGST